MAHSLYLPNIIVNMEIFGFFCNAFTYMTYPGIFLPESMPGCGQQINLIRTGTCPIWGKGRNKRCAGVSTLIGNGAVLDTGGHGLSDLNNRPSKGYVEFQDSISLSHIMGSCRSLRKDRLKPLLRKIFLLQAAIWMKFYCSIKS